jgi:hypothetical protein
MSQNKKDDYTYLDPDYPDAVDAITFPDHQEWYQPGIFDISIPIHPDYINYLKPNLAVGDLVETNTGETGIVLKKEGSNKYPALRIKGADNVTYTVLIGEDEKVFIGYSLKKI